MATAPTYRTSAGQFDGKIPIVVNSPVMSLSSAASSQGSFVAPCDGTIVQAAMNLIQAPDGATAKLSIGKRGAATAYDQYSIATTHATGAIDLPLSGFTSTSVTKGDVIEFATDGAATTAGLVAITLVIMPR